MSNKIHNGLSGVLLLGIFLKKMPLKYVQTFLQKSMELMQQKHSAIFVRLANQEYDFVIDATDLPFVFYLKPHISHPILKAIKREEKIYATAFIRGSFVSLLQLFEGKIDGDAAFFSKDLIIEGSTAAIVALRNAIDGEDMDIINDLADLFHPWIKKYFINLSNMGYNLYNSFQDNLDILSGAITQDSSKKILSQEMKIQDIFEELDGIQEALKRLSKEQIRKKSDYLHKE